MAAGVGPTAAAKMRGHSPTMFMETYAHLLPEVSKETAALVDAFMAAQPAGHIRSVPR